ncbi:hypothetical protein GCM10022403_080460 [Streptomyces coacervatus]|uniref:Uncharacterized protein n=1 Tax=Streptomyces coacervatus TaxID=647381 RepID=A0ABP7J6A0_9ACTN|nr:hypothetical protein [Streptomyces coacervatus]MDF2269424.1 hypothetical protein [Streptomyces coacervatus]
MRTARSALGYTRILAALLGPDWTADSCGHSDLAVLGGPAMSLEVATPTPVRASGTVKVSLSHTHAFVWPRRSDHRHEVIGTIGDPQAVADAILTTGLPAWTRLLADLSVRTDRTLSALKAFMTTAEQLAGPEAQVAYGSVPGVADLRWPGGRATIHADAEGGIRIAYLDLSDLTASTFVNVLRTVTGAEVLAPAASTTAS